LGPYICPDPHPHGAHLDFEEYEEEIRDGWALFVVRTVENGEARGYLMRRASSPPNDAEDAEPGALYYVEMKPDGPETTIPAVLTNAHGRHIDVGSALIAVVAASRETDGAARHLLAPTHASRLRAFAAGAIGIASHDGAEPEGSDDADRARRPPPRTA